MQIARPFVLNPDCIEIFSLGSKNQHDFSRCQSCKDVRLVLLTKLVFKSNCRKEHLQTRVGQFMINLVGNDTVLGSCSGFICFFVADEHIKRLFGFDNLQNLLLQFIDCLCLFLIDSSRCRIRILKNCLIISISQERGHLGTVTSGNPLFGEWVFHILNTILAENHSPVGFCLSVIKV